ncbi:petA [Symbiodinium microadriaticum]|nr:petA [Symbiodinium microadriaticum]
MSYTPQEVDEIILRLEKNVERQIATVNSAVKGVAAERDLLSTAEASRDLLLKAVAGEKDYLDKVFGGSCERIGRFRHCLDPVKTNFYTCQAADIPCRGGPPTSFGALLHGDVVEVRCEDDGMWYEAVVEHETADGSFMVRFDKDGYEYHYPLTAWRVPKVRHSIVDLKEGEVLKGRVTDVTSMGCYVDIGADEEGFVHISQIRDGVDRASDEVRSGQDVTAFQDLQDVTLLHATITQRLVRDAEYIAKANMGHDRLSLALNDSLDLSYFAGVFLEVPCPSKAEAVTGLLPVSEMADFFVVGDELLVRVIGTEEGKLVVSAKPIEIEADLTPFRAAASGALANISSDVWLKGVVKELVPFGAFVELQVMKQEDVSAFLQVGQEVDVRVKAVREDGKTELTMRMLEAKPEKPEKPEAEAEGVGPTHDLIEPPCETEKAKPAPSPNKTSLAALARDEWYSAVVQEVRPFGAKLEDRLVEKVSDVIQTKEVVMARVVQDLGNVSFSLRKMPRALAINATGRLKIFRLQGRSFEFPSKASRTWPIRKSGDVMGFLPSGEVALSLGEEAVKGFVHVAELDERAVDEVFVGDSIRVRILDTSRGYLELSLKCAINCMACFLPELQSLVPSREASTCPCDAMLSSNAFTVISPTIPQAQVAPVEPKVKSSDAGAGAAGTWFSGTGAALAATGLVTASALRRKTRSARAKNGLSGLSSSVAGETYYRDQLVACRAHLGEEAPSMEETDQHVQDVQNFAKQALAGAAAAMVFTSSMESAVAYPIFAQQNYANPREYTGKIVCANCHLASKPIEVRIPQAVLPDTVFKTEVEIPAKYAKRRQPIADGSKAPMNIGAIAVMPEGWKLAPKDRLPKPLKKEMKGLAWQAYSKEYPNIVVAGPVPGETYEKMVLPVLAPDPNTNDKVLFGKGIFYFGGNRGRGQVYPEGNQSNNNQFFASATGTVSAVDGLKVTITTPSGETKITECLPGADIVVQVGDEVEKDEPITTNPNVGGFGQEEKECILQDMNRVYAYCAFAFSCFIAQLSFVLKKKQFEKDSHAVTSALFSDMHKKDPRWQMLQNSIETVEAVLKDLGTFKPWVPPTVKAPEKISYKGVRRRMSPGRRVNIKPDVEGGELRAERTAPSRLRWRGHGCASGFCRWLQQTASTPHYGRDLVHAVVSAAPRTYQRGVSLPPIAKADLDGSADACVDWEVFLVGAGSCYCAEPSEFALETWKQLEETLCDAPCDAWPDEDFGGLVAYFQTLPGFCGGSSVETFSFYEVFDAVNAVGQGTLDRDRGLWYQVVLVQTLLGGPPEHAGLFEDGSWRWRLHASSAVTGRAAFPLHRDLDEPIVGLLMDYMEGNPSVLGTSYSGSVYTAAAGSRLLQTCPEREGDAFNCTGQVSAAETEKFRMRLSNATWVRHFRLFTNITTIVPNSESRRKCEGVPDVDAGLHYVKDAVPISEQNFAREERSCFATTQTSRFFCIRGSQPERSGLLSVGVQASSSAQLQVHVETQQTLDDRLSSFSLDIGGKNGRAAFHLWTMPEDEGLDLWRLRFKVPEKFQRAHVGYHAYIMHESSPCIAEVMNAGGCLDPVQVWSCFRSVPVSFRAEGNAAIALSESFSKSAMMTVSRGSLPQIQSGRWLLFVVCNLRYLRTTSDPSCPEAHLEIELSAGHGQLRKLWTGAAIMILGPALFLFCVNGMHWLTYTCLYTVGPEAPSQSRYRLWPVFVSMPNRGHLAMVREKLKRISEPVAFFPALLALMVGVFLATAAQFVLTHYGLMVRTGNRDVCFYNERCYHPGVVWDIPWNHVLSNLAYIVAGVHTMLQTFFAESRCRHFLRNTLQALFRQEWRVRHGDTIVFDFIDETDTGRQASRAIDVRAFYAIATAFIAEGVGSTCYHLCPSVETFQFDTCFMISIAHLLTIALADCSKPEFDTRAALKYFVYILTPMWLINFIGTWYDLKIFTSTWLYWTYTVLVVMWTVGAVSSLRRLFGTEMGACSMWTMRLLQGLIILVVLLVYVDPSARESLGGTANTFLLLSIAVMAVVVSRQIYMQDLRFVSCGITEIGGRILKHGYLALMVGVGVASLQCFSEKDCLFSIFDLHDCWHLLSAVALALFSTYLLDIRIDSWARQSGIQVVGELPSHGYAPVPDLETSEEQAGELKVDIAKSSASKSSVSTSYNGDLEAMDLSEGMLKP